MNRKRRAKKKKNKVTEMNKWEIKIGERIGTTYKLCEFAK